MICQHCGVDCGKSTQCPNCGASTGIFEANPYAQPTQRSARPTKTARRKKKKPMRVLAIAFVTLAVFVVVVNIITGTGDKKPVDYSVYVDRVEILDMSEPEEDYYFYYWYAYLTADCDWNNITHTERVEITRAAYAIAIKEAQALEFGPVMILGHAADGKMAFNGLYIFVDGKKDRALPSDIGDTGFVVEYDYD